MRWFGLGWMLAALASCTSDNPEFDGEVGPVPMRDTDDGDSAASGTSPASGLVTTDSAGSSGTSAGTTGDDGVGSSDGSEESEGSSGSSIDECSFEKAPFRIEVANVNLELVEPDCIPLDLAGVVTVRPDGSALEVELCDGECSCETASEVLTVSFGETGVVSDVYGGCRRVRVWASPAAAVLGCDTWTGFSVEPTEGPPYVIGSNELAVELPTLEASVQLGSGEECGEQGCDDGIAHPGEYALAVDGVEVWRDDEPAHVVFGGHEYALDNRTAHVTEACALQVSWRAELR